MNIAVVNIVSNNVSGGYEKYLAELVPRLAQNKATNSMLYIYSESQKQININIYDKNIFLEECIINPFLINFNYLLRQKIKKYVPDIIFIPIERLFYFKHIPVVNLLQNMEPFYELRYSGGFKQCLKLIVQKSLGRLSLKRANGVIVPSRFCHNYLKNKMGFSPKSITSIYYGVDNSHSVEEKPLKLPKNWKNEFIFTAGSIKPARGLEDLLGALKILNEDDIQIPLVIAGNINPDINLYYKKLRMFEKKHGLSMNIIWTGKITKEEMKWCYRNCKMFVMTSRVESFGMIATESMANGCLSISAKNPPLPEIYGDSAIFYKPFQPADLAKKIKKIIKMDPEKFNILKNKARLRAKEFSWDECANRTIEFFKHVIREDKNGIS